MIFDLDRPGRGHLEKKEKLSLSPLFLLQQQKRSPTPLALKGGRIAALLLQYKRKQQNFSKLHCTAQEQHPPPPLLLISSPLPPPPPPFPPPPLPLPPPPFPSPLLRTTTCSVGGWRGGGCRVVSLLGGAGRGAGSAAPLGARSRGGGGGGGGGEEEQEASPFAPPPLPPSEGGALSSSSKGKSVSVSATNLPRAMSLISSGDAGASAARGPSGRKREIFLFFFSRSNEETREGQRSKAKTREKRKKDASFSTLETLEPDMLSLIWKAANFLFSPSKERC